METTYVRNVHHALKWGVKALALTGKPIAPRGMPTLEYPEPVATVYAMPNECVLSIPERDANPFFHLFEALWILSGRQDVNFLSQFNGNIRQFSDDGVKFHAPYGFRLREHFELDQLKEVAELLEKEPDTRRAVLSIWDAKRDLTTVSKDIPCNDLLFIKVRDRKLHMRVCCRSNDMIWGAYGANAVQFYAIMSWLCAATGYELGTLTQISDSFHVYCEDSQSKNQRMMWKTLVGLLPTWPECTYCSGLTTSMRMVSSTVVFDKEVKDFCNMVECGDDIESVKFKEYFLEYVAVPMLDLWRSHQNWKMTGGLGPRTFEPWKHWIFDPQNDWLHAASEWIQRRENKVDV